ncbi:hypothetical protein U9M48_011431 [Paspalum notatum var. saurae]|uniref:NB-ARC domain-containing protein n=1 Tax=Paspalum notatum var. saurae TaxID=547442 RepID=A0AAQ3SW85_PASNO
MSQMEIFLSAVAGDITTRSIDFVISKLPKPAAALEDRLHRVLLRAQIIVDEAMGRQVTNQAMLQQLGLLSDAMHRGCYLLDTFRYQSSSHNNKDRRQGVSHPSSLLSRLNSVRDLCFPSGKCAQVQGEMREVLDRLSSMILDANELVLFLASYAPSVMYRQPYSVHLLLGNCMFGRQIEAQFVIDFLLHHPSAAEEEPEVLPIIGPFRVGKSTLVAHVCKDQRIHDHFSETVILSDHDLTSYDGLSAAFREGRRCATKHQDSSSSCKHGPVLLVVEVVGGDLDEDVWNRFYSAYKRWVPIGSKIIITNRSDKISRLGTTQTLTLKPLSPEAYWYFFRTLAFGSTDPTSHPRLTNLAMEIATTLNGSMIIANVSARMLRDSFDVSFWGKFAAFMRAQFQKHVARFGEHPYDLLNQNKAVYFGRIHRRDEQVIAYHQYRHSSQKEVPKITLHDVTYGDAELPGRFEVLAWRSAIPPYSSYVYACELQVLKVKATSGSSANKRKRSARNGSTLS